MNRTDYEYQKFENTNRAFMSAIALRECGQYQNAIYSLGEAAKECEGSPAIHLEMARNLDHLGQYRSARERITRAVEADHENVRLFLELSNMHILEEDFEGAVQCCETYLGRLYRHPDAGKGGGLAALAYYELGSLHGYLNRKGLAKKCLERFVEISRHTRQGDNVPEAYYNLAIIYSDLDRLGKAEFMYRSARNIKNAEVMALRAHENPDRAQKFLAGRDRLINRLLTPLRRTCRHCETWYGEYYCPVCEWEDTLSECEGCHWKRKLARRPGATTRSGRKKSAR